MGDSELNFWQEPHAGRCGSVCTGWGPVCSRGCLLSSTVTSQHFLGVADAVHLSPFCPELCPRTHLDAIQAQGISAENLQLMSARHTMYRYIDSDCLDYH